MKIESLIIAALLGIGLILTAGRSETAQRLAPRQSTADLKNTPMSTDHPQMTDIHDIKPLRPPGPNPWLLYGLPAVLLVGMAVSLWVYREPPIS